jgi:hypothetical protein
LSETRKPIIPLAITDYQLEPDFKMDCQYYNSKDFRYEKGGLPASFNLKYEW